MPHHYYVKRIQTKLFYKQAIMPVLNTSVDTVLRDIMILHATHMFSYKWKEPYLPLLPSHSGGEWGKVWYPGARFSKLLMIFLSSS